MTGDSEMKNATSENEGFIDVEKYRKLVRSYIDMVIASKILCRTFM